MARTLQDTERSRKVKGQRAKVKGEVPFGLENRHAFDLPPLGAHSRCVSRRARRFCPGGASRAEPSGPVMAALSAYMAAAKDRALPADVVEKAKHHILDTFAAMVSGSELPPGRAALALARAQAGRAGRHRRRLERR